MNVYQRKVLLNVLSILIFLAAVASGQDGPLFPDGSGQPVPENPPSPHVFVIDCDPKITADCHSLTLDKIASEAPNGAPITINISISMLMLTATANFSNLSSVTLQGTNSTIVCARADVGLAFRSAGSIRIENIAVSKCGSSMILSNNRNFITMARSAVHMHRCQSVTMLNVRVSDSDGSGLSLQLPQGDVYIRHCNFTNNTIMQESSGEVRVLGGNGIILYISRNTAQEYRFIDCNFVQNVANSVPYNFILSSPLTEPRGRGGGMLITIKRGSNKQMVFIINSKFQNNQAFLGAGLSTEIEGGGHKNLLKVINTNFTQNGCSSPGIGGGVYLSYEGLSRFYNQSSSYGMYLNNVRFDSNCAQLGGGTYFFSDRSDKSNSNNNKLTFKNCTWTRNYAYTGSAVDLGPNFFVRAAMGYLPTPVFEDCKFFSNTISPKNAPYNRAGSESTQSRGSGTLHSSLISIKFKSSVTFAHNFGSAIIIVNGIADFQQSDANFTNNRGTQGGAVLLIGTASLVIGPNHMYYFVGNRAHDKGGAIYSHLVDDTDFVVSRSCFIQYQDDNCPGCIIQSRNWTASLIFDGNRALRVGHSIYATSVIPCQVVTTSPGTNRTVSRYQTIDGSEIFQPPGVQIVEDNRTNHMATEGSQFDTQNGSTNDTLQIIPGEVRDLGIRLQDDFGNEVGGTFTAYVTNDSIEIDSEFSCITDHTVKLSGQQDERGELVLQTISSRKISLTLSIKLLPCPPAFRLSEDISQCMCNANAYVGIEKCDSNFTAFLTPGFWAGYILTQDNHTELATSICPVGFCTYNGTTPTKGVVKLPRDGSKLEEAICDVNRRGVLCGECREGYTTHYHSRNLRCRRAEPVSCKLGWLFYLLSELVPVTFVFLFVLVLNINFNTGAVNGFILFSQVLDTMLIDASGVIKFNEPITILSRGYQIIYGFFNLDLFSIRGLSFCIWENATPLDMLAFKYITVGYSLLLVLSVILFMRYSAARCFGRYYSITALRNSVIHGLSGFLVLCYSQCIKVSFSILYNLDLATGHTDEPYQGRKLNRVFFNGNIVYLSPQHLPYAIPAIIVLVLIGVIPPLVLLGYPLLNRFFIALKMEKSLPARCLNRADKLKPLLDSFQGCFKDKFRFFAGIYFFYRWPAVITYALFFQLSLFYTVLQGLLIVILVVHSMCQPYLKRWHNILDTLLLTDLIVINGLTTLLYYWIRVDVGRDSQKTAQRTNILGSVQLVLIYLPLLYILIYLAARLLGKTVCKGVREEPVEEDFVLKKLGKKIYRLSSYGKTEESVEDTLPYRLMNGEEADPFQETSKVDSDEDDTPIDTYFQ